MPGIIGVVRAAEASRFQALDGVPGSRHITSAPVWGHAPWSAATAALAKLVVAGDVPGQPDSDDDISPGSHDRSRPGNRGSTPEALLATTVHFVGISETWVIARALRLVPLSQ